MFNISKFFKKNKATAPKQSTTQSFQETPLNNYIKYYLTLEKPGFAVLVTGPWGVGKTYQIKQAIPEEKSLYVSLYGINNIDNLHAAVLSASFPKLNTTIKTFNYFTDSLKNLNKNFAFLSIASKPMEIYMRSQLKPDRVIIFDDLERSTLWKKESNELMGAINYYVEHKGFNVIVICHDESIKEQLNIIKEKTFGHTIRVLPQTEIAIDSFIEKINDIHDKNFIKEKNH